MSTKDLVMEYFEALKARDVEKLKDILAHTITVQSPIGDWNGINSYLSEVELNRWNLVDLELKKLIYQGEDACLIYSAISSNPRFKDILFAEWLTFRADKISSILSSFDATTLRQAMTEI